MSQATSTVSVSLDLETQIYLDNFAKSNGRLSRSQVIRYHIKMGRVYLKQIDSQFAGLAEPQTEPQIDTVGGAEDE